MRLELKGLPAVTRTAIIAEIVVAEIANTATDNAPIQMAVREAKKIAKNPPAAANDMRRDITTAFRVAATKNNMKTRSPVRARRAIVPTWSKHKQQKRYQ